ncbi:MAG: fasciclin domain-containing protein [Acidimicrobiales bacterium]|nr:fasciclin domain-containing protein [Acidimicrobiales bacterium]
MPHHPFHRRRTAVTSTALVTLFALAGASCSDDPADTAAPPTTPAPASTVAPTTTLMPAPVYDIVGTALLGGSFIQLAGYVVNEGLVDTLRGDGPFTVFAPTDSAFEKIPGDILRTVEDAGLMATALTYHVLPGEYTLADLPDGEIETVAGATITISHMGDDVYVNGNKVAAGDVDASNGVVHVMGDVLVPPIGDIIDVATTLPGFETLAELVTQADLVDTLKGEGPFTVFAPLDGAFEALPQATLDAVLADPDLLATVLTYHVVPGKVLLSDLQDGDSIETVAGIELEITKDDAGNTLINGIPVAVGNVQATNGVIHVLGEVLVPPS